MGLKEGLRAHLLPEELTATEKQRQDERVFERQLMLGRGYERARRVLLWVALLTLGTILLLPRQYKLSFPLSVQFAQLAMAYGYMGNVVWGFGLALLIGGVFLLLWWLSRRHPGWMIAAAVLTALDSTAAFLMLNVVNYDHAMYSESAGVDVAAGIPDLSGMVYDYMTVFFITVFLHGVVVFFLVRGAVYGLKRRALPAVDVQERTVEKAEYYDGQDYTEHPEEGTVPLRPAETTCTHILQADVQGMQVEVSRAFGVTVLAVDGQVYNDQKGQVEPLYHLRACVNGVHLDAENRPMSGYSLMTLYVNGEPVEQKKRFW